MRVLGIDFTSKPTRRKPLTCASTTLREHMLEVEEILSWPSYQGFEEALRSPGPWIAGIDFPFGQARTFITNMRWPLAWPAYVQLVGSLGRDGFRDALNRYKADRPAGDKEHRRQVDVAAKSISPQKLFGVPVGLMFFEGARRLVEAGVMVPLLLDGDTTRVVVEAYPGILARRAIGRRSYKNDDPRTQTPAHRQARREIAAYLESAGGREFHGFSVSTPAALIDDPSADRLDALLCAVQTAWAWTQRECGFGIPSHADPLEGWICDPQLR